MPNAVFIPAELNDLSVDVALGTPAQGAVMYRGAAKWNALAAGGAGQVLTSGGINANPSWAPVSADLSAAVVLAPATANRNLIQGTNDSVVPLRIDAHSATQSANLQEWRTSVGLLSFVDERGALTASSDDANFAGLTVADSVTGFVSVAVNMSGQGVTMGVNANNNADVALTVFGNGNGQTADVLQVTPRGGASKAFRVGTSGGADAIGFFGNLAVQQATASAAGITGIRTDTLVHAVADLQTILTALRAWGVTFGLTANTA